MRVMLHWIFVFINALCGFRPCAQYVTKDWQVLASAKKRQEVRTTLLLF